MMDDLFCGSVIVQRPKAGAERPRESKPKAKKPAPCKGCEKRIADLTDAVDRHWATILEYRRGESQEIERRDREIAAQRNTIKQLRDIISTQSANDVARQREIDNLRVAMLDRRSREKLAEIACAGSRQRDDDVARGGGVPEVL